MSINVYCDNEKVFSGLLAEFLTDNDNEEWLTSECAKLENVSKIEFTEISGHWIIERK